MYIYNKHILITLRMPQISTRNFALAHYQFLQLDYPMVSLLMCTRQRSILTGPVSFFPWSHDMSICPRPSNGLDWPSYTTIGHNDIMKARCNNQTVRIDIQISRVRQPHCKMPHREAMLHNYCQWYGTIDIARYHWYLAMSGVWEKCIVNLNKLASLLFSRQAKERNIN